MNVKLKGNFITKEDTEGKKYQEQSSAELDDVSKIDIELGEETKFRIEVVQGELLITKTDFSEHRLQITPCVSNQIRIK